VLAHDFKVVAVNAANVERVVDIRPAIYHGYLAGACIVQSSCWDKWEYLNICYHLFGW